MYILTDFSVFIHLLHAKYLKHQPSDEVLDRWVRSQLCVYMGGEWLGSLRNDPQFIWLLDGKPYWRLEYLKSSGIEYKGGRKESPESFLKLYSIVANTLLSRQYRLWRFKGYEADDLAALFVKQSEDRPLLLATVDKDWKGLIRENVSWFSLRQFKPEYRYCNSLESLNGWLAHSKMQPVDSPEQLWARLSQYGDSADGLPKGSALEVIDLLNPPEKYRLWERVEVDWGTGKPVRDRHLELANEWLQENGFTGKCGEADTVVQRYRENIS